MGGDHVHGSSRALVLKLAEGLQARQGGAEVDWNARAGDRRLGN